MAESLKRGRDVSRAALLILVLFWPARTATLADQTKQPPQSLCYAFLRDGDVFLACNEGTERITQFGDVENFAVPHEKPVLAVIRHRDKEQGRAIDFVAQGKPYYISSFSALQVFQLNDSTGGQFVPLQAPTRLYASCGTIVSVTWDPAIGRRMLLVRDVSTGERIQLEPFKDFRCSSDRRTSAGWQNRDHMVLEVKVESPKQLFDTRGRMDLLFDVSPNGRFTAFNGCDGKDALLCVVSGDSAKYCIEQEFWPERLSVSDAGGVVFESSTDQFCRYQDHTHFYLLKKGETSDQAGECPGIYYWAPGEKASKLVQPLARTPQWISKESAAALREWRSRGQTRNDNAPKK